MSIMSKLPFNKRTLKTAAKVAGFVGVGAIAAQAGSEAVKRGSTYVRDLAARSPAYEAAVDAVCGLIAAGLAHIALKKLKVRGAAAAGPLMFGGAIASAVGPMVLPRVMPMIDGFLNRLLPGAPPGGAYFRQLGPGGAAGFDLPMAGGASSMDIPQAMPGGGASSFDLPLH